MANKRADPMGAVADMVKFLVLLVFVGLVLWVLDVFRSRK